tara:strand:- start:767 stop:1795 length:1029 start_codon:yes stop_codon:yes gene_type:complete
MKILVTGGAGFIGSNFINYILNKTDFYVINIDKLTYAGSKDSIIDNKNYKFYKLDICDYNGVSSVLNKEQPNIVVNFAAESHVDKSIKKPDDFIKTNVLGVSNLLNCSLEYYNKIKNSGFDNNNFKFIHISTDEVYGSLKIDDKKFNEKNKYFPSSPYAASKASSDHLVYSWYKTYGLPTIITNCSNNYGPFQFPEKLIPFMIINCLEQKSLPLYGNGENIRDWIYVIDHCKAIVKIMQNGSIGENYNIGGSCEKTNNEIVQKICLIMDEIKPRSNNKSYSELIVYVEDRLGHDFRYAVDSSKLENDLGWKPQFDFDSNLKKTIKWYLDNVDWWSQKTRNQI